MTGFSSPATGIMVGLILHLIAMHVDLLAAGFHAVHNRLHSEAAKGSSVTGFGLHCM